MQLAINVFIVLIMAFGPRLMVLLAQRVKVLGMLGAVFLCYACGFLLSLVLPDTSLAMDISEILIPIAIPLILFSADLSGVKRLAKPMIRSFLLVAVSVTLVSCTAYFAYRNVIPDSYKYAGMIVGLYTGGTPNLMAIGTALDVDSANIVLANASDVVVGGIYFLMLISFMPRLARRFLPKFTPAESKEQGRAENALADGLSESFVPQKERFSLKNILARVPIVLLAVLSLAVAAGLALLITGELNVVVIMLTVTTCGVALSFIRKVRKAPGSFSAGQYIILMFSFGIGLSFDLGDVNRSSLLFLAMFATAQFGAVFLHLLLSKLCRIDADTALITSTAGIYGPAFIAPVGDALQNREVVLPGLICGILGYAIGNYLGIGVALLLKLIGG